MNLLFLISGSNIDIFKLALWFAITLIYLISNLILKRLINGYNNYIIF